MKARHDEHPTAHQLKRLTVNHPRADYSRKPSRVTKSTLPKYHNIQHDTDFLQMLCDSANDKLATL